VSTDLLSRGFDIPELKLVINVDVPRMKDERDTILADFDTYMHRTGRAGRFG
jgi:ATP-dependent RNA helicase DDX19/DBP5